MKKIFVVEDQEDIRIIYGRTIAKRFDEVTLSGEASTGEEALAAIPIAKPDLVLVDVSLPGMDGIELVRQLHQKDPAMKFLIMTGYEREMIREAALKAGAEDVLEKGDVPGMIRRIAEVLSVKYRSAPAPVKSRT